MRDTFVDRDLLVEDLFQRWGELRDAGKNLNAADLVQDPDLQAALQLQIDRVRKMEAALIRNQIDAEQSDPDRKTPAPDLPGYTILRELARGAQGVVYHARHRALNRETAIKVLLHPKYAGKQTLYRFDLEAKAIAAVNHPHVLEVFESARHHGTPYIAMEFCPRGTLADRLKRDKRIPPREAAVLLAKIAGGVGAGHEQGIVHRDLKPGNVLFDAAGEPKVADFGLARIDQGEDQTATGFALGTPQYMSPEHANGETRFAGPTADVWSLGVILYECLAGTRPFKGKTHQEVYSKVIAGELPPLRRAAPDVPKDLERIVRKCLHVDPARRYDSAQELEADLKRFLDGEPVAAGQPGAADLAARWVRRRRTARTAAWAFGTGVAVLLPAAYLLDKQKAAAEAARAEVELLALKEVDLREKLRAALRKADEDRGRDAAREAHRAAVSAYAAAVQNAAREIAAGKPAEAARILDTTDPAVRGWEFAHLKHVATAEPVVLGRDKQTPLHFHAFALSPDGKRVATAGADGVARVWDTATGLMLDVYDTKAERPLRAVAYSPDGKRLATAGDDRNVRVWDLEGGRKAGADEPRPFYSFPAPGPTVTFLAFDPKGTELAAANGVKLFLRPNTLQGIESPQDLPPEWAGVRVGPAAVRAVTPDGRRSLVLAGETLRIRDTGRATGPAEKPTAGPNTGNRTAALAEGRVRVVDAETGTVLLDLDAPPGVTAAQFTTSGELKAYADAVTVTWTAGNERK